MSSAAVEAKDNTQYDNNEFEQALAQGKKGAQWLNNSLIKPKDGKTIPLVKAIERNGTGQWKTLINGAWLTSSTSYQTVTYPGIVINHGDRFEYAFIGQPLPSHLVELVRNHKGMLKAEKAWKKKHKDMQVTVGIDGNRITLNGAFSYADGVSRGDIADRLKALFIASNGVLIWSQHAGGEVEKDYMENLQKNKLTHLSKADFLLLTGDGLSKVEKEHDEATEGYWDFTNKGRSFEMFNYGDRAMLTYYRHIPGSVTGDERAQVLGKIQKLVDKNKVKNAGSKDALWHIDDEEFVWVRVHFPFDGTLKGEKFYDGYWDFKNKFASKLHKEIDKVLKKYE